MLYGSETWPVKEQDVVRLERIDARMVIWMYNVRPEDVIPACELRTRIKSKSMRELLLTRVAALDDLFIHLFITPDLSIIPMK